MITTNRLVQQIAPGRYAPRAELINRLPAFLSINPADSVDSVLPVAVTTTPLMLNFTQPNFMHDHPSYIMLENLVFEDSSDGTASNNCSIKLTDSGYNRDLMAYPLHMRAIFGTAQLPGVFYEPLILQANGNIRAQIQKISGGSVNLRPYLVGTEFFDEDKRVVNALLERKKFVSPFWLTPDNVTLISLAGNASANYISQNGRGHFQASSIVAISSGNFSLELLETKTNRTIMNGAISQTNGIGNANYPHEFKTPFTIPRGFDTRWKITNLTGSTNNIYVALAGKMYECPLRHIPQVERDLMIPYDKVRL